MVPPALKDQVAGGIPYRVWMVSDGILGNRGPGDTLVAFEVGKCELISSLCH